MKLAWMGFAAVLLVAVEAHAVSECTNDINCTADSVCGGKVCNWIGLDHLCQDATGATNEGWCSTANGDADCKCAGLGAKCVGVHCTFTVPPPDLFGVVFDLTPPPDLKPPPDLLPPPPDLVPPPPPADLTGVTLDLIASSVDASAAPADLSAAVITDLGGSVSDMASADLSAITCDHDTECPGTACGGQVCRWFNNTQMCVAAGTDPQGTDGWCNTDAECKCRGEGATCDTTTLHCTFTKPKGSSKSGCHASSSAGASGASLLLVAGAMLLLRRRQRAGGL